MKSCRKVGCRAFSEFIDSLIPDLSVMRAVHTEACSTKWQNHVCHLRNCRHFCFHCKPEFIEWCFYETKDSTLIESRDTLIGADETAQWLKAFATQGLTTWVHSRECWVQWENSRRLSSDLPVCTGMSTPTHTHQRHTENNTSLKIKNNPSIQRNQR